MLNNTDVCLVIALLPVLLRTIRTALSPTQFFLVLEHFTDIPRRLSCQIPFQWRVPTVSVATWRTCSHHRSHWAALFIFWSRIAAKYRLSANVQSKDDRRSRDCGSATIETATSIKFEWTEPRTRRLDAEKALDTSTRNRRRLPTAKLLPCD